MLQPLGPDNTGRTVYPATTADPGASLGRLSARTGLSEDQTEKVLAALAELGLARASRDAPGRWEPVSSQAGPMAIVQQQEAELARRQHETNAAEAAAAAVAAEYTSAFRMGPLISRLAGWDSVCAEAHKLAHSAVAELQVTVPAPQPSGNWPAATILDAVLAAGLRLKALYRDSAREDQQAVAQMTRLATSGAQVRTASSVPPVLLICDQQAALLLLEPAGPGKGAMHVREPAIVAALVATFASAWHAATPLTGTHLPAGPASLTTGERALLRLLASGLTDDAAARRLGISVRTVRRQVAVLMAKLGAASRFQAGRKAAERGWL